MIISPRSLELWGIGNGDHYYWEGIGFGSKESRRSHGKTNEFHPSLRTPVYTFISLFHVVCLVAWIIVHFTNHKKPEPTQNVDVANTAVWTCRTMTVTLMISRRMIPRRKRRERPRKRMIKRTLNLKYSVEILNCNIKTFLLFKYS